VQSTRQKLYDELSSTNPGCTILEHQIELLKICEEKAQLNLAENKMVIHNELEIKEDQIKHLKKIVNALEKEIKTKS